MSPIAYDPSAEGLFHPERRPPLDMAGADWSHDARCAELSRLAYLGFERDPNALASLAAALATAGLHDPEPFGDLATNTEAFGARAGDGTAYIVFRGTQPGWYDLLTDMAFLPSAWPGNAKVHGGFRRAFEAVWPQIKRWLRTQPPRRIVATGHSLGAALATLLAARIGEAAELVTFGSPRVGNRAFAATFDGRAVRRHVNCCDYVTEIPYRWMGFEHVGALHYHDRFGQALGAADAAAIAADRHRATRDYLDRHALRKGNVPTRKLADHAPVNYVSALLRVRADA